MRRLARCAAAFLLLAPIAASHDIINPFVVSPNPIPVGAAGVAGSAWGEIFQDPNGLITVTAVTQTPANPACILPLDVQFGVARGFNGSNGFVISNTYIDDLDDDGVVTGDPTACASGPGVIGPQFCTGVDPTLAMALGTGYGGAPVPTSNAAIFKVDFTASVPTTLDVAYTFMTFELPSDGTGFYDSFGIFLDSTLIAGGVSLNPGIAAFIGGPVPGTDPWALAPSAGLPAPEFNRAPLPGFWIFPAKTTGLRTIPVLLSAGAHSLEFHIADGGPASPCPGIPTPGACEQVGGGLFFGLSTYDSGLQGNTGICGTAQIRRLGHPAETAPPHGPIGMGFQDFQVRETGAAPGSFAVALIGLAAGSIPVAPPCHLLINPAVGYFDVFLVGPVPASGQIDWPPAAPAIPAGSAGGNVFVQFWNVLPGGALANTKGMRINIGPS